MADSSLVWAPTRPDSGGVLYRAPLGTPLPSNAISTLNTLFTDHGWLGDEGITQTINRDIKKHYAFGADLVKTTQGQYSESYKLSLLETDPDVLETVYGAQGLSLSVDGAGNRQITVAHRSKPLPRSAFVIQMVDGTKVRRLVLQEAAVVDVGDVTYVHSDILKYTITVDCYKPASGNSEAVIEYIHDAGHASGS